jgi:hypothetical protein
LASESWALSDPCLIDLALDEDGNTFAFYDYPPARGAPPPMVQWAHDDTPNVRWLGLDFESCFAAFLAGKTDSQAALVAAVVEDLGLPASWVRENTAPVPSWLAATFGRVDVAAIDSAERAGDLLRAERLLVGAVSQTYDEAAAAPHVARLGAIYQTLGWHRQLRTLRGDRG